MPVNKVNSSTMLQQQADDALVGCAASLGRAAVLRIAGVQAEHCVHQRREAIAIDHVDTTREHAQGMGHRWLVENFGLEHAPKVAWHIDPQGHVGATAARFALMGFDAFVPNRVPNPFP